MNAPTPQPNKSTQLGIDALKSIVTEILRAAKAAADGYENEDLLTYFNTVVSTAREAKNALAEVQNLDGREGLLLTEHTCASVREAFFPESNSVSN